jgi:1-phosphatidylinositol-4-phosphate 5-kinase
VDKLAFPPNGSTDGPIPTPPHDLAHTFKFKSYSPKIFGRIRDFFDISAQAYMSSVCGKHEFME